MTYANNQPREEGVLASCVRPCPFADTDVGSSPCLVLFYEYAWQSEAKHFESLVVAKATYVDKLEAIPAEKLSDSQHRQLQRMTKELQTLLGLVYHMDNLRQAYLRETARLGQLSQSLLRENQWLRQRLDEGDRNFDFILETAILIARQNQSFHV